MSPRSCHHWIRRSIANSLRTEDYYTVDTLIGGYDDYKKKAFLGSVDYLGNGVADQVRILKIFFALTNIHYIQLCTTFNFLAVFVPRILREVLLRNIGQSLPKWFGHCYISLSTFSFFKKDFIV